MANPARTLLINYNGEIYNFPELRAELETHGVRFETRSDVEVLLKAWEHWGEAALAKLRGMFAFALWNEVTRECFLVRDRLGIKPLYYAVADGSLYFASEATALLAAPPFARELDLAALGDFLAYGYVPGPRSIWRGIRKLAPGHRLCFHEGTAVIAPYWDPAASAGSDNDPRDIAGLLAEAVALHTVSDVPVGTFLSGGLDSSTVTALMAQASSSPIHTYSIDFTGTGRSESRFARELAERYGTRHRQRIMTPPRSLDTLRDALACYDEPLADESVLPTVAMAEEVARHIKVVLSGDGGDEIFAGYAWYRKAARIQEARRRLGPLSDLLAAVGARGHGAGGSALQRLTHRMRLLGGVHLANYFRLIGFFDAEERQRLLPASLTAPMNDDVLWHLRRYWVTELPVIRRLQLLDLRTFLADDILVKVDRASMHYGLEVRVPLLDHRLVEAALGLPVDAVFHAGEGKRILRTVARELVPESILTRHKQGFGVPRSEWNSGGWDRAIAERLAHGELARRRWVDGERVGRLAAHPVGRNPNKTWLLLSLDLWLEAQRVL